MTVCRVSQGRSACRESSKASQCSYQGMLLGGQLAVSKLAWQSLTAAGGISAVQQACSKGADGHASQTVVTINAAW